MTLQGGRTMETLDALTGVLRKRLRDGVWATAEGAVFENVVIRSISDEEINQFDNVLHGLDWGYYPHPASYGRMHYDSTRRTLYIFGEVRMWRASNEHLYETLKNYGLSNKDFLIADSAEEKSISDFRAWGLNCRGAEKGPGSIRYGVKWLQSLNGIIIDPVRAPYHAEEFVDYEYERTKDGEIIEEYPDENDHAIDDTRYATNLIWRRKGS
jgi:phage terminase large subunit